MEMEKTVLLCDDDLESIYSAIYEAFILKLNPAKTHIYFEDRENVEFFTEYIYVDKDEEKAE